MVQLVVESSIWWSLVIIVAASRFISRRLTLGAFRRFQADDYLMILALAFYTTLIVTINIVQHTSSNLLPPGFDVQSLSPSDIAARMYGSKLILVVEQCQCVTVWATKGCLIIMYLRLTSMRNEHLAVKILGAYVVITFVVMEVLYFAVWCRPFYEYWAVPTNSVQCDAATDHLITNACFNLTSDCCMLAIGLPMFLRMKIPWQRKLPLIFIFSLGIFVILAAVLNKVYSFTQPFGSAWSYWYVRESSTALLVANLPFVWNFWRRVAGLKSSVFDSTAPTTTTDCSTIHDLSHPSAPARAFSSEKWAMRADESAPATSAPPSYLQDNDLSLTEWLADTTCARADEKDGPITPYTHPALFFAQHRPAASPGDPPLCRPMERALVADSSPLPTVRRDSRPEERTDLSSPSSAFPSSSSERSTGSFV